MRTVVVTVTRSRTGWLRVKRCQVVVVVTRELQQVAISEVMQHLRQFYIVPAAQLRRPVRHDQVGLSLSIRIRFPAPQHRHEPRAVVSQQHTVRWTFSRRPCPLPFVQPAVTGDQSPGPLIHGGQLDHTEPGDRRPNQIILMQLRVTRRPQNRIKRNVLGPPRLVRHCAPGKLATVTY